MTSKVLVTGGSGFIGAAVGALLNAAAPDATVVMSERVDTDLMLLEDTERLVQSTRPDTVVHLAGMWGGRLFARHWNADVMWANSLMLLNLVGVAAQNGAKRFLTVLPNIIYSASVAANASEKHIDNGGFPGNYAPYANYARFTIQTLKAFEWQYGVRPTVLIAPEVYGPGGNFNVEESGWMHNTIREMKKARDVGEPMLTLPGDKNLVLPQLYISDMAEAVGFALSNDTWLMNVASGIDITFDDAAKLIAETIGYAGRIKWDAKAMQDPSDVPAKLDISLMNASGFKPVVEPLAGIRKTIDYFQHL